MKIPFKVKRAGQLWSVLAVAFVLSLGSASAGSRKKERPLIPGSETRNLCAELLTRPELATWVEVEGAPGLRILDTELNGARPSYKALLNVHTDAFHPHELVSSARYARYIQEKTGETVLMVPGIEHKSIPGFDGVIFNAEGVAVANYSLKTLLTATGEHTALARAEDGIRQAKKFSFIERWFLMFNLVLADESGHLRISHDLSSRQELEVKIWLTKTLKLFGLKPPTDSKRPTRVVVDIQSDVPLPDEADVAKMKVMIQNSNGLIESIIVIKGDEVIEVR